MSWLFNIIENKYLLWYISLISTISPSPADVGSSSSLMAVLTSSQQKQMKEDDSFLSIDQVLRALAIETMIKDTFVLGGLAVDALEQAVKDINTVQKVNSRSVEQIFDALSKYATNITSIARNGKLGSVIDRYAEIDRAMRIISRRTKNSTILVGLSCTGKIAIAAGLSHRIDVGDVLNALETDVFSFDMGALIASAYQRGE